MTRSAVFQSLLATFLVLTSALAPLVATAQTSSTAVAMGAHSRHPGDEWAAPIALTGVASFGTATVDVYYDQAVVEVVSVAAGDVPQQTTTSNVQNTLGKTRVLVDSVASPSGDFTLATLNLRALGAAGAATALDVRIVELRDGNGNTIASTATDGSVVLVAPPAPDLGVSVDGITLGGTPVEGASVTVRVTVTNRGDVAATGGTLRLDAAPAASPSAPVGSVPIGAVGVGDSVVKEIAWTPAAGGETSLYASIADVAPAENGTGASNDHATRTVQVVDYELAAAVSGAASAITSPAVPATFVVMVTASGNADDAAILDVEAPPAGWSASVSPDRLDLAKGETLEATVTVTPPAGNVPQSVTTVLRVTARSESQPGETAHVDVETVLENLPDVASVTLSPASPVRAGEVAFTIAFTKDMDAEHALSVTFGPAGDLAAVDVAGAYVGARTWEGTASVAPGTDGAKTLRVADGVDASGLRMAAHATTTFSVDTTAPVTTDDAPAAWQNGPTTVTLAVEDESATTTRWTTDGSDPTPESPTGTSVTLSTEGEHTLRYASEDAAGNVEEPKAATNLVRIDLTDPTATATPSGEAEENGFFIGPVRVDVAASDALSGVVATFHRRGSAGEFVETAGDAASLTLDGGGAHVVEFYARDAAGNEGTPSTLTVRIDGDAPTSTLALDPATPASGWHTGPVTATVTGADASSGVAAVHWRAGGEGAFTRVAGAIAAIEVAENGFTLFEHFAEDALGQAGAVSSIEIRIDAGAPVTTDDVPAGWLNELPALVRLTVEDALSTTTYYTTDGSEPTTASPRGTTISVGVAGTHTIRYFSVDSAGNAEAPKTAANALRIDVAPPATTLARAGVEGVDGWMLGVAIVSLSAVDAESGVAATRYRLDGGEWTAYDGPFALSTQGATLVEYASVDVAGNEETARAASLRIDATSPRTTMTVAGDVGAGGWWRSAATVTLAATDATSGVASTWYSIDGGPLARYTGPFAVSGAGAHVVSFNSTDAAGNRETPRTASVRVDLDEPSVAIAPAALAVAQGQVLRVRVTASDANLADAWLYAVRDGVTVRSLAAEVSGDSVSEELTLSFSRVGTVLLVAQARDEAGRAVSTSPVAITVVDGSPPQVNLVSPADERVSGVVRLQASATDNLGLRHVEFLVDGVVVATDSVWPFEGSWDSRSVPNGEHALAARATDLEGNARTDERRHVVANLPSVSEVTIHPLDAELGLPRPSDRILVNATIGHHGATAPTVALAYRLGAAGEPTTLLPARVDGARYTFDLGMLPASRVFFTIRVTDSAGNVVDEPASGYREFTVLAPDRSHSDAPSAGPGREEEHGWVDLVDTRVNLVDGVVYLEWTTRTPIDFSKRALYVADFYVNGAGDGSPDYNLTLTYEPVESGAATWRKAFRSADGGLGMALDPASGLYRLVEGFVGVRSTTTDDGHGRIEARVPFAALWEALGYSGGVIPPGRSSVVLVGFRTLGSSDATDVTVLVDLAPPALTISGAATSAGVAIPVVVTIVDASAISLPTLHYRVNGGAARTIALAAAADGYAATIPAADVAAGTILVHATAFDALGNAGSSRTLELRVAAPPPTGAILAPETVEEDALVEIAASALSAGAVSLAWDFGDGATGVGASVTHAFTSPGARTIALTIGDAFGTTTRVTRAIQVTDALAPVVVVSAPLAGAVLPATAGTVVASVVESGAIASAEARFDDGAWMPATVTGSTVSLAWDRAAMAGATRGVVVRVRATDAAGHVGESAAVTVVVDGVAPVANAGADGAGTAGAPVAFSAAASADDVGIASFAWAFGDGSTSTGPAASHAYASAGTYTASLTVTDLAGNVATDSRTVTVAAASIPPAPGPGSGPTPGSGPASGAGSGSGSGSAPAAGVALGAIGAGATREAAVATAGVSTITLTAGPGGLADVRVAVTAVESGFPAGVSVAAPGSVLAYLDITVTSEGRPASVAGATVRFAVPKARLAALSLAAEHVALAHWTGAGWKILPTTLVGETADAFEFGAITDGFSPFAVVAQDRKAPVILTTKPADGERTSSAAVAVAWRDDGLVNEASVALTLDGAPVKATTTPSGLSATLAGLAPGRHTLALSLADKAGNRASKEWSFDFAPHAKPTTLSVALESPGDGALVTELPIALAARVQGAPSSVRVTLDGEPVAATLAGALVEGALDVEEGEHVLVVTVADATGGEAEAVARFTVDVAPPTIAPQFPKGKVSGVVRIPTGAADAVAVDRVDVIVDGAKVATLTEAPWVAEIDAAGLAPGEHPVRLVSYDRAGRAASSEGAIDVAGAAAGVENAARGLPGFEAVAAGLALVAVAWGARRKR